VGLKEKFKGKRLEHLSKFLDLCLLFASNGVNKVYKHLQKQSIGKYSIADIGELLQENNVFAASKIESGLCNGNSLHWHENNAKKEFIISTLQQFLPLPAAAKAAGGSASGLASGSASGSARGGDAAGKVASLARGGDAAGKVASLGSGGGAAGKASGLPPRPASSLASASNLALISGLLIPAHAVQIPKRPESNIVDPAELIELRAPLPDMRPEEEYDPGRGHHEQMHDNLDLKIKGGVPSAQDLFAMVQPNHLKPKGYTHVGPPIGYQYPLGHIQTKDVSPSVHKSDGVPSNDDLQRMLYPNGRLEANDPSIIHEPHPK
jgi:hypothetical protein